MMRLTLLGLLILLTHIAGCVARETPYTDPPIPFTAIQATHDFSEGTVKRFELTVRAESARANLVFNVAPTLHDAACRPGNPPRVRFETLNHEILAEVPNGVGGCRGSLEREFDLMPDTYVVVFYGQGPASGRAEVKPVFPVPSSP